MIEKGVNQESSAIAGETVRTTISQFDRVRAYYVVVAYASASLLYILISDLVLFEPGIEQWTTLAYSLTKGFAFVVITSALIYLLIRWNDRKRSHLQDQIYDLNEMMNQKEIVSQVVRLESIGLLAAGMAHNLNNNLAVIEGNVDMIDEGTSDANISKHLQAIRTSVTRTRELSDTLLSFSEGGEPVKELTEPGKFVAEVAGPLLKGSNVKLSLDVPENLSTVLADRGQLRHAYENVLINSLEAMPDGGTIFITAQDVRLRDGEIADLGAGEYVRIELKDTGHGMSEEALEKMFDPYFSTRGQNRGLGMTLAQSVIRRHGGVIVAESSPGQGAKVVTYLPVHRFLPDQNVNIERRRISTGKVLWMDDEEDIRDIVKDLVEHLGYEAHTAKDGQEALDIYQSALGSRPFDVVVLDLAVPNGMGGAETMERLLTTDPGVRAIVCSGYYHDPIMAHHLEHGFLAALPKPFSIGALETVLKNVLE